MGLGESFRAHGAGEPVFGDSWRCLTDPGIGIFPTNPASQANEVFFPASSMLGSGNLAAIHTISGS